MYAVYSISRSLTSFKRESQQFYYSNIKCLPYSRDMRINQPLVFAIKRIIYSTIASRILSGSVLNHIRLSDENFSAKSSTRAFFLPTSFRQLPESRDSTVCTRWLREIPCSECPSHSSQISTGGRGQRWRLGAGCRSIGLSTQDLETPT